MSGGELFPNKLEMRVLMKINRRNTLIWNGHTIAVPRVFEPDPLAYSPFPKQKSWTGQKHIVVDLKQLAWAAYEPIENGKAKLLKWGPAAGGVGKCRETGKYTCKTPVGIWQIYEIKKGFARSSLYPVECTDKNKCGHPYYNVMKFGPRFEALHGERAGHVSGTNISHGCVRMFREDSEYLINYFVEFGTMILVERY